MKHPEDKQLQLTQEELNEIVEIIKTCPSCGLKQSIEQLTYRQLSFLAAKQLEDLMHEYIERDLI